jgi:hypothetical protein
VGMWCHSLYIVRKFIFKGFFYPQKYSIIIFFSNQRISGSPPFWHRRQVIMLRMIMEGNYSFSSPEWDDISDNAKDLVIQLLKFHIYLMLVYSVDNILYISNFLFLLLSDISVILFATSDHF